MKKRFDNNEQEKPEERAKASEPLLIQQMFQPPSHEQIPRPPSYEDNFVLELEGLSFPNEDESDPFEGIEDLDEVDYKAEASNDFNFLRKSGSVEDEGFDAVSMERLSRITGFSYLENKLSEINRYFLFVI